MVNAMNKPGHLFPSLLAKPLSLIPDSVHASLVSRLLNQVFSEQIADGELNFLNNRYLRVQVMDAAIQFTLTFDGRYLVGEGDGKVPDLIFRGNVHDFLLLASRREDCDTLFFQRRLRIEGDTDMGLAIKNFLDAIEIESLPYHRQMDNFLGRAIQLYEHIT